MPGTRRTRRTRRATRAASSGLRSSLVALLNSHKDLNLSRSFLARIQAVPPGGTMANRDLVVVHPDFPRKDASGNYAVAFSITGDIYDKSTPQPMMIIKAHKEGSRFTSADIEIGNRLIPETFMLAYPEDLGHVESIGLELSKATGQVFGLRF
jgi:hypothetical protein